MQLKQLPVYAVDLIDELDKLVPHLCIRKGDTLEEAHRYAGKRDLVDSLLRLKAKDEEQPPKPR